MVNSTGNLVESELWFGDMFADRDTQRNRRYQTSPPMRNSRRIYLLVFNAEQNLVGISTSLFICLSFSTAAYAYT